MIKISELIKQPEGRSLELVKFEGAPKTGGYRLITKEEKDK